MATPTTFEGKIEVLTGLAITSSTTPSQDDISYLLSDAIKDVISKVKQTNPTNLQYLAQTDEVLDADGVECSGAYILDVYRQNGVAGGKGYRQARRVSRSEAFRSQDPNSLHYATKHNPVFYIDNTFGKGRLFIVPAPSIEPDKGYVTHVKTKDVDEQGTALTYASESIKNMPDEYEALVVMCAAIKALEVHIAYYNLSEEDPEIAQAIMMQYQTLKSSYSEAFGGGQEPPREKK